MKLFAKYFLLFLTFLTVVQASIQPLKSSYDPRSSEYGVRYYDPRTSVWQSPDPIIGEYMSGETKGGVLLVPIVLDGNPYEDISNKYTYLLTSS